MIDCIFCKIIAKNIPARICYEDEQVLAFDDIHPKAPLHKLIIPKCHISTLNELTDQALAGHLLLVASKLAKELGVADYGYRVSMNCNHGGGQEVYHVHLHLMASPAV